MGGWHEFQGLNAGYVLELYERYRQDPASVDPQTRAYFEQWTPPEAPATTTSPAADRLDLQTVVGAATLAEVGNYVSARLSGLTLREAQARLGEEIRDGKAALDKAAQALVAQGLALWSEDGTRPVLIGQSWHDARL